MNRRSIRRGRSPLVTTLVVLAFVGVAGCSSSSDGDSSGAAVPASTDASASTSPGDGAAVSVVVDDTSDMSTDTESDTESGDGSGSEECGGLSAADVGAAVGAGDFTSATDVSIDGDVSCSFGNPTEVYGVGVASESTSTYLAGEFEGLTPAETLDELELVVTTGFAEDATTSRVTVDGNDAVLVLGSFAMADGVGGRIATVADGNVVIVDADGSALASDASGFEPIVTNVLALALSKN